MDFSLNEVQAMLADSVEKFIDNEYDFETRQQYAGSDDGFSRDVWQQFAELGWTTVPFAEADGGFDGGPSEIMVMMQRFGRGLIVEPYLANVVLAGGVLKRAASDDQKAALLAPMMGGEMQLTVAFVEPQSGYEIADVATTARADGSEWVLEGSKGFVLNAGTADVIIVPARTSGKTAERSGITLFAVRADASGVGINAYPTVDGLRAAEVTLAGVRVGSDAVIGEIDAGFEALAGAVEDATLAVCAEAVGIMQVLTEKTIDYAKSRVQFGVPIGSFQALQHRMVDMFTTWEQAWSLLMWAVMTYEQGGDDAERAVSSIKYLVGTAGRKLGEEAVQIHGGMGVSWELDVAHYFKRLIAIGQLFGNADWHLDRLAD